MFNRSISTPSQNGAKEAMEERPLSPSVDPVSDSEVIPKAKRRKFTKREKQRILKAADACKKPGELGALLRSEGVYSSYLTRWRKQLAADDLAPKKRGRRGADPSVKELARLRAENARLSKKLEQAEAIIEVQKKLSDLLGLNSDQTEKDASK